MPNNKSRFDLRKKLKGDNFYNPFNDNYDPIKVLQDIKDNYPEIDKLDLSTTLCSIHFNDYYKSFYAILKDSIHNLNLEVDKLNEFLFSAANRDYYLVLRKAHELWKNNEQSIPNFSIDSKVKEFGKMELSAAIEGTIDFLNTAINFTRYFRDIKPAKHYDEVDSKTVDSILNIYRMSNLYDIVKKSYDSAIWEDGYIVKSKEENTIFIRYKNEQYPIIIRIASHRRDSNIIQFYLFAKNRFEGSDPFFKSITEKHLRKNNTDKRIQSVYLDQGFVKVKLEDGQDIESIFRHIRLESSLAAYYLFIQDTPLTQLNNLTLNELIALFVEFQRLLSTVVKIEVSNDEIRIPKDFQKFIYRLKIEDLANYLIDKTVFSESQIEVFLKLLEYAGDRYDLWSRPLVRQNDYYLFLFLPIIDANILYLVDFWLEQGGCSLDDRGLIFEDHVKQVIRSEISEKGFNFYIPQKKKFIGKHGGSEEIDLIVNLKHILLVAEVKCIKYPMEPRHFHNALKRLTEGASQVNRKANFIDINREFLENEIGNIEGKDILKIVITNYPIFTGLRLEDVPIVDFLLLESYINTGEICDEKVTFQNGIEQQREKINAVKFYNNEDEFSKNMRDNVECPIAVEKIKSRYKLVDQQITLEGFKPVIFSQMAISNQE